MRLTRRTAKEETLLVWKYLAEHGEITKKEHLPAKFYHTINKRFSRCSLCHYFHVVRVKASCDGCPLQVSDIVCYMYHAWLEATTNSTRIEAANAIVDAVEAWEIK
jgi:hypothetical protein